MVFSGSSWKPGEGVTIVVKANIRRHHRHHTRRRRRAWHSEHLRRHAESAVIERRGQEHADSYGYRDWFLGDRFPLSSLPVTLPPTPSVLLTRKNSGSTG